VELAESFLAMGQCRIWVVKSEPISPTLKIHNTLPREIQVRGPQGPLKGPIKALIYAFFREI